MERMEAEAMEALVSWVQELFENAENTYESMKPIDEDEETATILNAIIKYLGVHLDWVSWNIPRIYGYTSAKNEDEGGERVVYCWAINNLGGGIEQAIKRAMKSVLKYDPNFWEVLHRVLGSEEGTYRIHVRDAHRGGVITVVGAIRNEAKDIAICLWHLKEE
ncbi:MAG: hypothetical protein QXO86_01380 [Nitrososphaerota archaeon]